MNRKLDPQWLSKNIIMHFWVYRLKGVLNPTTLPPSPPLPTFLCREWNWLYLRKRYQWSFSVITLIRYTCRHKGDTFGGGGAGMAMGDRKGGDKGGGGERIKAIGRMGLEG